MVARLGQDAKRRTGEPLCANLAELAVRRKLCRPGKGAVREPAQKQLMSRAHHHAGGEPSQRMLRVAELIRHAVSELLVRSDLRDPVLDSRTITIPEVRMSPDLKLATIYVMPLGGKAIPEVLAALERHKKH